MKNDQKTNKPMASAIINYLVKGNLKLEERIAAAAFVVGLNEGAVNDRFNAMLKLKNVATDGQHEIVSKLALKVNEEYIRLIPLMEDHDFGMSTINENEDHKKDEKNGKKPEGAKELEGSKDSKDNPFQEKGQTRPLAKGLRAKGMSQDELAAAAGVDKSTISRIKLGVRKPSFELMKTLSDVFGDVQSLFPELS